MSIRLYKYIIVLAATFFIEKSYGQTHLSFSALKPFNKWAVTDSLSIRPMILQAVQKDLYVKNLGFMCKQEWKIEKSLRIPLRLRVGSLEQCNYLEGK